LIRIGVTQSGSKRRSFTSRLRSGEREGPIAKQWDGEGHPCCTCVDRPAFLVNNMQHAIIRVHGGPRDRGAPHPPNADALGPSLSR
jgi:hypothetical protein